MIVHLFLVFMHLLLAFYSFGDNAHILRSKKFDCSYLVSQNVDTGYTNITIVMDNKDQLAEPIELLESISFIDIVEEEQFESLLCYSKHDPYVLYYISLRGKGINRISIEHLLHAQQDNRYLASAEENGRMFVHGMVVDQETLFLAVSNNEHQFGNDGSFILALFISQTSGKPIQILPFFILPITEKDLYVADKTDAMKTLQCMVFEKRTQTLLCGLKGETNNAWSNPLSALLCVSVKSESIYDESEQELITKKLVVVRAEEIHEKSVSDIHTVSIDEVRCMMTSTALPYFVLRAQHDALPIRAFPLSDKGIALVQQKPTNIFFAEGLKRFVYRLFTESVKSFHENDLHNPAGCVGGGLQIEGEHKSIKIFGDAVVTLVQRKIEEEVFFELYRSVALFEPCGTIKGWTEWQLLFRQTVPIADFELDHLSGQIVVVEENDVKKVGWNPVERTHPLLTAIDQLITTNQYIKDATVQTIMIQGESVPFFGLVMNDVVLISNLRDLSVQLYHVRNIGQLHHVCIAFDDQNEENYIFVTGSNGIVRLMLDDHGIVFAIEKISDQGGDIKKIILDSGIMYAISERELYRATVPVGTASITWLSLLTDEQKKEIGRLRDFIISDSLGCIMSFNGLWTTKPESTIRDGVAQFERFLLPQQMGVPVSISFLSRSGKGTDVARYGGGNIFVLCADFSLGRSQLYRISIKNREAHLFEDIIFENKIGPFFNFGSLQTTYFTDGYRFLLLSSNKQVSLSNQPRLGIVMGGNKLMNIVRRDFQNSGILYTGSNKCTGELFVVTEESVYIYN